MATLPLVQIRACRKCGVEKPATLDFFYKHEQGKFGLRSVCQDCKRGVVGYSEQQIAARWDYEKRGVLACRKCGIEKPHDQEHFTLKLGKLTPLCRECNKADCQRRFFEKHEARKAENRERWHANKASYQVAQRRWYIENIDRAKARDRIYRQANWEKRKAAHREWSNANPDRIASYCRAYQQSPAGKASQKRRAARYWEIHRERLRARQREAYHQNAEEYRRYGREWRRANRDRCNAVQRKWNTENKHRLAEWSHKRRVACRTGRGSTKSDVVMILDEQGGCCAYCGTGIRGTYEVDHFIPIIRGGGNETENIVLACRFCNRSKGAKMPWDWCPVLFRRPPM